MLDKIYIQQSAIDRMSNSELLKLLEDWKHIVQYWKFTPDIELQIKRLI